MTVGFFTFSPFFPHFCSLFSSSPICAAFPFFSSSWFSRRSKIRFSFSFSQISVAVQLRRLFTFRFTSLHPGPPTHPPDTGLFTASCLAHSTLSARGVGVRGGGGGVGGAPVGGCVIALKSSDWRRRQGDREMEMG
jgi:hypothetical protein